MARVWKAHQASCAHLPCAVAALAAEVLAVGEDAAGSGTLQWQSWVYEGGRPAVMVHKERLRRRYNHVKQVGRRI